MSEDRMKELNAEIYCEKLMQKVNSPEEHHEIVTEIVEAINELLNKIEKAEYDAEAPIQEFQKKYNNPQVRKRMNAQVIEQAQKRATRQFGKNLIELEDSEFNVEYGSTKLNNGYLWKNPEHPRYKLYMKALDEAEKKKETA